MKIDILCYFEKCNGVFTSMLDIYYNLSMFGYHPTFTLIVDPRSKYIYKKSLDEFPTIKTKNIITYNYDILIVSADFILKNYNIFKYIKYKHLLILDSTKIYIDYTNKNYTYIDVINSLENKTILGNKFNSKYFHKDYMIYYHNFSYNRLQHLKSLYSNNISQTIIRDNKNDFSSNNIEKSLHCYLKYNYNRFHTWDNGKTYIENIGKLIFEFLYLGKKVYYSPKNKTMDDGLTEYLNLFGIDDNIEQELKITPEQIEDKLFMKDDDIIIQLIKSYE